MLDLFCGAGGAAVGYKRAADKFGIPIEIFGVDNRPQPNYPFTFTQDDALSIMAIMNKTNSRINCVHASPPCQAFSAITPKSRRHKHPDLVLPVRLFMQKMGVPSIIENVVGSPVHGDCVLSGNMFGLKVLRKRKFEFVNWFPLVTQPIPVKKNVVKSGEFAGVYGNGSNYATIGATPYSGPGKDIKERWSLAMGIDWMKERKELVQAIPPAYTQYLGELMFSQFFLF